VGKLEKIALKVGLDKEATRGVNEGVLLRVSARALSLRYRSGMKAKKLLMVIKKWLAIGETDG